MADELYNLESISIFPFTHNWVNNIGIEYQMNRDTTQFFGTGTDILIYSSLHNLFFSIDLTLKTKEDIYNLLDFFNTKKGQLQKFWVYGSRNEFELAIDKPAMSNDLYIYDNGFDLNFYGNERIYLQLKNGDILTRLVTNVSKVSNTLKLEVSTIVREIEKEDILQFGRIYLCRFAKDVLNLNYKTENICSTQLDFVEVIKEYVL
jgi:hypothetical protein